MHSQGFPGGSDGKESACNAGDLDSIPGVRKISWRKAWLPTPVFSLGKFHGPRSLAGYSPWGHKESDTTEQPPHTHTQACFLRHGEACSLQYADVKIRKGSDRLGTWAAGVGSNPTAL